MIKVKSRMILEFSFPPNHSMGNQVRRKSHPSHPTWVDPRKRIRNSASPVVERLSETLEKKVALLLTVLRGVKTGSKHEERRRILLENLRFHPEEERTMRPFQRSFSRLCDVYVNDALAPHTGPTPPQRG
jgi:phosphoglycerate kinase